MNVQYPFQPEWKTMQSWVDQATMSADQTYGAYVTWNTYSLYDLLIIQLEETE